MAIIKSSSDHLTINADGASKDIKFQANGVEKASISSAGAFTSTTIDATVLTGDLPVISGANLTGLPAGGITDADQWRLTSGFTGNVNPIESNLERVDNTGFSKLGTGMTLSTPGASGGQWTFPATGIWRVEMNIMTRLNGDSRENYSYIHTTTDNSSYTAVHQHGHFIQQTQSNVTFSSSHGFILFDVVDTSLCKVKFSTYGVNTSREVAGNTDASYTYFTFTRLGDT